MCLDSEVDPGTWKYYGSAELKQSDHRPVVCNLEFEIYVVEEEKRDATLEDIIQRVGPPDATVVIKVETHLTAKLPGE